MKARTCKQYVELKGSRCPVCGGKNLDAGELWLDDDVTIAHLDCWCDDCGAQWSDKFKLVGYKNLREGSNQRFEDGQSYYRGIERGVGHGN